MDDQVTLCQRCVGASCTIGYLPASAVSPFLEASGPSERPGRAQAPARFVLTDGGPVTVHYFCSCPVSDHPERVYSLPAEALCRCLKMPVSSRQGPFFSSLTDPSDSGFSLAPGQPGLLCSGLCSWIPNEVSGLLRHYLLLRNFFSEFCLSAPAPLS